MKHKPAGVEIAALSLLLGAILVIVFGIERAQAQDVPGCGDLQNAYGPFDYRDPTARTKMLPRVEQYHFTRNVEFLVRGTSGTIAGDLNYTLRAFPNHPRALQSVARYELQGGRFPADSAIPSAECFFQRALVFAPDDATVHVTYAYYLFKRGERQTAREQYEEALRLAPESAEINYNAGLFFLGEGEISRAKQLAQVAYDNGYPLPGLRNKIAAADAAASGGSK